MQQKTDFLGRFFCLFLAVPTGIEPARSNLGVTELLELIWAEKPLFVTFCHFTSLFVTFQAIFESLNHHLHF
jgi:hypothetical protein